MITRVMDRDLAYLERWCELGFYIEYINPIYPKRTVMLREKLGPGFAIRKHKSFAVIYVCAMDLKAQKES